MSPERWREIEAVFQSAMDLAPTEREAVLAAQCGSDKDLRAEVEKLLNNLDSAESFIESPVWTDSNFLNTSAKKVISDSLEEDVIDGRSSDFTGTQIGPYRLVKEIGRGGMGAVYRAERVDGEFSQLVAVKLIKRGMDSDFIIRRFRHERQILASFEHPFIARLLDGGTTKEGVPYFVMEFIEGSTIYEYCDKRQLDIHDRLKIFLKVCSALEYAHERKIVHRDIKPSNILINRSGAPKLLDFGIAKILDPNLIHESINPTASIMRMMTPDYASPEQIQGVEVTPASDIYSLGILLYELLTGHRPYNFAGRSVHEVSRVICEVSATVPSQIISKSENLLPRYAGHENAFAEARKSTPKELSEALSGDLDNVVMKALSKEPLDRYNSVLQLADDITKYLKGETVNAQPFNQNRADRPKTHISPPANTKVLAVLPFRFISFTASDNTDDRFLGVGLADALISRLSKVRLFLVRPTSSILSFSDEPIDPIRAGRELNADYILDGSIKKAKDRLRVSVQLLKVQENAAVWATSIDEKISDIFTLEDTLSNKLIEVLLPQLTGSEIEGYSKRGTDSPEAFEHYLRGRYYFNSFTEEGLAKAFVSFHRAIAADSNYPHAYCGIADYYNWLGIIGVLPPHECFQPAIEAATKAVELDGNLSEAHASLGFSLHAGNYDWDNAKHHLKRAIELNPGNANAYVWYSIVMFTEGRFDEGLDLAWRSVELDPRTPFNHHNVGWGLYYARRYREAADQYRKMLADFPDYSFAYYGLSKIHRLTGETRLALEENNKAKELMGNSILSLLSEAECLAADGQEEHAMQKLKELEELSANRYVSPYQLSLVYCYLGDKESALASLEKAAKLKDAWLNWAAVEPRFDMLSNDPRFTRLLESIDYAHLKRKSRPGEHPIRDSADTQGVNGRHLNTMTTLVIDEANETDDQSTVRKDNGLGRYSKAVVYAGLVLLISLAAYSIYLTFTRPTAVSTVTTASFQNPSIVVLPFRSQDNADDGLGAGLAEALTNKLGIIKSLQVISASSGRSAANSEPQKIGKDLGITFVLRGVLRRSDGSTSLNAEMVNTADGSAIWTQSFAAPEGDLFALQTQLAEKVWTSLKIEPLPIERQQVFKSYTRKNSAYELYLIGRYQMASRTAENLRKAVDTFSRSIKDDSNFALPYAGLADAYSLLNVYDINPPPDAFEKATENALKALAIDDDLAEAHASLGNLQFFAARDRTNAELEFRRAIQLNPSYAQAHHWFSLVLSAMNRPVEGLSEAKTAQRLDPRSLAVRAAVGMALFYGGQYTEAIEECDQALAVDETFIPAHKVKRWAYTAMGNFAAARDTFRKEVSYGGGDPADAGWQIILFQIGTVEGDKATVLNKLDKVAADAEIASNAYVFAFETALSYNAVGEVEKALDWLEKAEAAHSYSFNFAQVDPRLANLRNHPRFSNLLRKLQQ